ncbi:MAG TPA: ATP-binding protein [bacterium]|nr:ATP-binding protein [bacterium]
MSPQSSRHEQIQDAALRDLRRRRRERVGIVAAALLVTGLLYLAIHLSRFAEQSTLMQPFVIYFFNFAVWALLVVLILVLVFLIVRNVAKFVLERRRGVLGSKIRIRLIMVFMSLTLGPAAVLFFLSTFILNTSIERLYSPHVANMVSSSKDVIQASARISEAAREIVEGKYEADGEDALHFAQEISRAILEQGWISALTGEDTTVPKPGRQAADANLGISTESALDMGPTGSSPSPPSMSEQLSHFLEYKRREYNLALVAVFDKSGRAVVRTDAPGLKLPEVPAADIEKALSGEQGFNPPVSVGDGAVIYAFYPVPRRGTDSKEIAGVAAAGRYISWIPERQWKELSIADDSKDVIRDYETLARLELPVKASYFILLVMVTLIVIFLAIWFGFYMAKGITEPIQLLAEGTAMVSSGNLDYRIEVAAEGDDEISTLVRSFNKMTGDLGKSRAELQETYQNLAKSNLELEQRRRYMETVLAQVAAGVISVDREENVSTVNTAALRMLGKSAANEVMGRPLSQVLGPEDMEVYRALVAELAGKDKEIVQRQVNMVRKQRTVVLLITVSPLKDEKGNPLGMVIVIDDMTELIRAHRAMAWREVARRIAHEIKNPLTPIQLSAQRLERRYAETLQGEDAKIFSESVHTIITQVEELKHLVNEFSLFARLPSTSPEPSDLHQIIREVLPLYREAHANIAFQFIEDPRLPSLELDREQMKRVLINLLDNAAASIEGEGQVFIEIMYNPQLQLVRLEIRDTGQGILPHVKDRLFEPYYSTKPHGSGLGLTIVQRIISDHYGYIRVVDNEPRGTKMIIELPVILAERHVRDLDRAKTM